MYRKRMPANVFMARGYWFVTIERDTLGEQYRRDIKRFGIFDLLPLEAHLCVASYYFETSLQVMNTGFYHQIIQRFFCMIAIQVFPFRKLELETIRFPVFHPGHHRVG